MHSLSAQQVARAVVTAASSFGEDPEKILTVTAPSRARLVALAALYAASETQTYSELAVMLNFAKPAKASGLLITARNAKWWPDGLVDEIVGELVTPLYGERAQ